MLLSQMTTGWQVFTTVMIAAMVVVTVLVGGRAFVTYLKRREAMYDLILRSRLLLDISPRVVTVLSLVGMLLLAAMGQMLSGTVGMFLGVAAGVVLPATVLKVLARRRLEKLEEQLVGAIQSLTASVRAGLNLVQAMELVGRTGPRPVREEFAHLVREYEYGIPLDEAMQNAAQRIGSGDYRLLFAALHTHRERGGDLGETLDRIAESIREIQRLEHRLKALTAQGRATARFMGLMPLAVTGIYYLIDPDGVEALWTDPLGKAVIAVILLLNAIGFLWVKKVVSIDI
jgi:tight adherence protein B